MNLSHALRLVGAVCFSLVLGYALTACGEADPSESALSSCGEQRRDRACAPQSTDPSESALSSCVEVCERTQEECSVGGDCQADCSGLVASLTADCQALLNDLQTCLLANDVSLCGPGEAPDTCNAEQEAFDSACRD